MLSRRQQSQKISDSGGGTSQVYHFRVYEINVAVENNRAVLYDSPNCRSGQRMIYANNCLYMFGGFNPAITQSEYLDDDWKNNCPLFQELWEYNVYRQTWRRLPKSGEMQVGLASCCAVHFHKYFMLIFGGTAVPFAESCVNTVYKCFLPRGDWKRVETSGSEPGEGYGQAAVVSGDNMYVVGGTSGFHYNMDVHSLNLRTFEWSFLSQNLRDDGSNPIGRYRHEIVEYKGQLISFGGGNSMLVCDLCALPAFCLTEKKWTHIETKPDPDSKAYPENRKFHTVVRYKNRVIIHGGLENSTALKFKDAWSFNLEDFTWKRLPFITPKLSFHSAAVTREGCMYLFGGVRFPSDARCNTLRKVWLDIPSLRTMAWEAIRFYQPKINNFSMLTLVRAGVPKEIAGDIVNIPSVR